MDKRALAKQLNDLAQWETNPFKKRAYSKAGQIISDMDEEAFISRSDFKDIEGIGDAINKKILQFKQTGVIQKWKELFATKTQRHKEL
jgi:DNA polymerase (family 10)